MLESIPITVIVQNSETDFHIFMYFTTNYHIVIIALTAEPVCMLHVTAPFFDCDILVSNRSHHIVSAMSL